MLELNKIFNSRTIAENRTEVESNRIPFMGQAFFPNRKKMGIDLKWLKTHKGLGIALKPSNFDAVPVVRPRGQAAMTKEEMPLFRESMIVKEHDLMELVRIQDENDPYLPAVIESMYDDTNFLVDGADISAEYMRMQLLSANGGNMGISIATADNMVHFFDYDKDGSWKAKHFMELTGDATWDKSATAKPLTDIRKAVQYLTSIGVTPTFAMMNSNTFDYLVENGQVRGVLVTLTGAAVNFMDTETTEEVFRRKTKLTPLLYDKMYMDYEGKEQKFYPDGYVTIIGSGALGNTWYGTTPEETTLNGNFPNAPVDISVLDRGVAIAVQTEYKPSFTITTTASQIVLPSFEGMDRIFVIKVK